MLYCEHLICFYCDLLHSDLHLIWFSHNFSFRVSFFLILFNLILFFINGKLSQFCQFSCLVVLISILTFIFFISAFNYLLPPCSVQSSVILLLTHFLFTGYRRHTVLSFGILLVFTLSERWDNFFGRIAKDQVRGVI